MFTRRPLFLSIEQQCTARLNIIITARLNHHQMLARSLLNNVTVLFSLVASIDEHIHIDNREDFQDNLGEKFKDFKDT